MTLNAKIGGFHGFFGDFGMRGTFQERIALKSLQIDQVKLHMKFSALNMDFDCPSLDFQGNLRTRASKSGTPVKVVILPLLANFS